MRKVKIKRGIFRHPPWWLFIKSTRVIGELLDSMWVCDVQRHAYFDPSCSWISFRKVGSVLYKVSGSCSCWILLKIESRLPTLQSIFWSVVGYSFKTIVMVVGKSNVLVCLFAEPFALEREKLSCFQFNIHPNSKHKNVGVVGGQ